MTQSEMQRRIAEDGWCVIDAVIPPEAVAQVRDSVLATVAAHKLPDPRSQLGKVSGLVNFDQSFVSPVVFAGIAVTIPDEREDYGERRSITLGALQGRVVVVAHTQRGSVTRIISMRKANEREQKIYRTHTKAAGRDDG